MAILAVIASAEDAGGAAIKSTTAGHFDSAFAKEAWGGGSSLNKTDQIPINHAAPAGDYWLHYTFITSTTTNNWNSVNSDGSWINFYDAAGLLIAAISCLDGNMRASAYGTAAVHGNGFIITQGQLKDMDVRIAVGTDITIDVYVGGSLISTATATNNGKTAPTQTFLSHYDIYYSNDLGIIYYSEFVIADGESTIGWRVSEMTANAAGAHAGWDGDYTAISDNNSATRISAASAGLRESWGLTAYGGPASPVGGVRGVVAVARATKGSTGPQNISNTLRIGTTDYDKTARTPDVTKLMVETWDTNPATGAAWATADLSGIQPGVLSVA